MKKLLLIVLALALTPACGGCSEDVPAGYVGMRWDTDGLDGKVLEPGRHGCWWHCKMKLLETRELLKTEKLSILCTDDLNITIDVKTRSRLKVNDGAGILMVLNKQGSQIKNGKLSAEVLYETYVKPAIRAITRKHVGQYSTTDIRQNRAAITKKIQDEILVAMKNTPVEVTFVVTSNIDYPKSITAARIRAKERQLKIKEEKAKQEVALLQADNRLKIAQKTKAARVAEAEGEAAYNTILAKSLSPAYLKLRALESQLVLYKNVGKGDKVIFVPDTIKTVPFLVK